MIFYGLDSAFALTSAGFAAVSPAPNWFTFYAGGPSTYHQWTPAEVAALKPLARGIPIFDGQNIGEGDAPILNAAQGNQDALAALEVLKPYADSGPYPGYVLDLEDDTWQSDKPGALAYADAWGETIRANSSMLPILYGDAEMIEAFEPSGPFGAWAARYPGIPANPPPALTDIPVSVGAVGRYHWIAWQYWAGPDYDLSVSDDRLWAAAPPEDKDTGGMIEFTDTDGSKALWSPATGFAIRHGFLAYWQSFGGLPVFGNPISREYVRLTKSGEGITSQMFERARFEWHPRSNAERFDVELGLIGDELVSRSNEPATYPSAYIKEQQPK